MRANGNQASRCEADKADWAVIAKMHRPDDCSMLRSIYKGSMDRIKTGCCFPKPKGPLHGDTPSTIRQITLAKNPARINKFR
jgi:hypothetical protein